MNQRTLSLSDTETSNGVAPAPDVALSDDPSLTESLRVTARLQLGYLRIAQLYAGGVSKHVVESRVRDGWWRRPTRGVIDLAADPPDIFRVGVRKVREAVLALMGYGPEAIAVGFTALTLHGVWGVPLSRTPQVSLPRASQRASRDGLVCRRFEKDVVPVTVHGMRVVPPAVALTQAVCETNPRTALGLLDSALHRKVITPEELLQVRRATRGRRGCRRLAQVWEIVDPRRESSIESGGWYDLWEEGLEPTDVQIVVLDEDEFLVARPDMGYEFEDGSWLFVDIDGDEYHEEGNEHDPRRDINLVRFLERRGIPSKVLRFRSAQLGPEGPMTVAVRNEIAGRRWRRSARSMQPNHTLAGDETYGRRMGSGKRNAGLGRSPTPRSRWN